MWKISGGCVEEKSLCVLVVGGGGMFQFNPSVNSIDLHHPGTLAPTHAPCYRGGGGATYGGNVIER